MRALRESTDNSLSELQDGLEPIGPMPLPRNTRAVVGRAPVMAPGDLRLLKAADPAVLSPALRKMTNVIVFPRCGTESEPYKMGGGDLDGDCFFIIWDNDLVPAKEASALDYSIAGVPHLLRFSCCDGHGVWPGFGLTWIAITEERCDEDSPG